jgi:hypothetical protein
MGSKWKECELGDFIDLNVVMIFLKHSKRR